MNNVVINGAYVREHSLCDTLTVRTLTASDSAIESSEACTAVLTRFESYNQTVRRDGIIRLTKPRQSIERGSSVWVQRR